MLLFLCSIIDDAGHISIFVSIFFKNPNNLKDSELTDNYAMKRCSRMQISRRLVLAGLWQTKLLSSQSNYNKMLRKIFNKDESQVSIAFWEPVAKNSQRSVQPPPSDTLTPRHNLLALPASGAEL